MDISSRWEADRKLTSDGSGSGSGSGRPVRLRLRLKVKLDDGDTEQVARGWVAKAVAEAEAEEAPEVVRSG